MSFLALMTIVDTIEKTPHTGEIHEFLKKFRQLCQVNIIYEWVEGPFFMSTMQKIDTHEIWLKLIWLKSSVPKL